MGWVMSRRLTGLLLCFALLAVAAPGVAEAARGLKLGYYDSVFVADSPLRGLWMDRAVNDGSDIVRINVSWPAPDTRQRPRGFDARNPADPAYGFARADAAIIDAKERGLKVLAAVSRAPRWAEGAHRPRNAREGSWRPSPNALKEYAIALTRRYSGDFPDPARPGRTLPRVDAFQAWNEPNLNIFLAPQRSRGRLFAPAHYRRMLNAFYRGVKSVRRSATVVTAGLAPYGDDADFAAGRRTRPALFTRVMLCVRKVKGQLRRARRSRCRRAPARFDVLAHHPYSVGRPSRPALNVDDVSIPDIHKLRRILRVAERTGGALPRKRHRLWVTEISYDSSPPNPRGVSLARHARWLQETLYLLWRQEVDTIMWYQIRDQPRLDRTRQAGTFFIGGKPKPAARAFRFPLVAERTRGRRGSLRVWGRSPVKGKVRIERRTSRGWRRVRTVRAREHGTFLVRVRGRGHTDLRARVGAEKSLVWHAR